MNIPELKKAQEATKKYLAYMSKEELIHPDMIEYLQTLLSACQLLCDASDKMGAKEDCKKGEQYWMWHSSRNVYEYGVKIGSNQRRSEDIQFFAKKMIRIRELMETPNFDISIPDKCKDDLADALRQDMLGGNK